jgi:hypothetical protein
MSIAKRILLAVIVVAVLVFAAAVVTYETIPRGNTQQATFDAIIVLGYPANADGSPSPIQQARVLEGVREYRASVAPRLIMTGGAAHNSQVEAVAMARFAEAQGVPENAVIVEPRAHDTIQNAFYSVRIHAGARLAIGGSSELAQSPGARQPDLLAFSDPLSHASVEARRVFLRMRGRPARDARDGPHSTFGIQADAVFTRHLMLQPTPGF